LPGWWGGGPQVLDLTFEDTNVTLINFHAIPPGVREVNGEPSERVRERQMGAIVALAGERPGPLLALGDLNAVDRSTAYAIITRSLIDAWRAAGWGLGHTFPGAASPGSSRPTIAGVLYVPMWLVRIDYVFHSDEWQALAARLGPWDGASDHRPVVAELALTNSATVLGNRVGDRAP
jgi:endonuclease/exonuclease/phosphatase (EEP) superfamily protein YafD